MIVGIRNLLTPAQCAFLCEAEERMEPMRSDNPYWDQRVHMIGHMSEQEQTARALIQQARLQIQLELIGVLRPPRRLYSDTAQLVRWDVGQELDPHADNIEPDGQPNSTPHRVASAVVYLNDDYTGGETFFPGLGFRVKPEPGLALAFGSGTSHIHGVTRITAGTRFMIAAWFTFDPGHMDPAQYSVY